MESNRTNDICNKAPNLTQTNSHPFKNEYLHLILFFLVIADHCTASSGWRSLGRCFCFAWRKSMELKVRKSNKEWRLLSIEDSYGSLQRSVTNTQTQWHTFRRRLLHRSLALGVIFRPTLTVTTLVLAAVRGVALLGPTRCLLGGRFLRSRLGLGLPCSRSWPASTHRTCGIWRILTNGATYSEHKKKIMKVHNHIFYCKSECVKWSSASIAPSPASSASKACSATATSPRSNRPPPSSPATSSPLAYTI